MKLFGTDGVRGKTSRHIYEDSIQAFCESRIFTKELCAEIAISANRLSDQDTVVIGWDRRGANREIAMHTIERLTFDVGKIITLSETTTPALQYEMVRRNASLGVMITASHNPASDSGVKILFRGGRKPTIEEERSIELSLFKPREAANIPTEIINYDSDAYISKIKSTAIMFNESGTFPGKEVLIDGSRGWISDWLCRLIKSIGGNFTEVGHRKLPINDQSGAGELKEGHLSWEECKNSKHALLSQIERCPKGEVIGFCFDGDGDRCYLVGSNGDGAIIVGGDGFLKLLYHTINPKDSYLVAVTIESSLDVSRVYGADVKGRIIETGVGDRWLQHSLLENDGSPKFAAEPSGHIIMEQIVNGKSAYWGDGIFSMFKFLDLINKLGEGWIDYLNNDLAACVSHSISPSDRVRWSPRGDTGNLVTRVVSDYFDLNCDQIQNREIIGEDSLLLMDFIHNGRWSIAVRNSGTESKTRVTIRTTGVQENLAKSLMEKIVERLSPELIVDSKF